MGKVIIGVMGPGGAATAEEVEYAFTLGQLVAREGWVLLSGGRGVGVMDAVNRGARAAGGLTVGILPGQDASGASPAVDIAIVTGLGNARNSINVLSSDVVVACGMGAGTASEVALALKSGKKVVLLCQSAASVGFFKSLAPDSVSVAQDAVEAVRQVKDILSEEPRARG